jgi:PTH1 family peptidyl-tRNA hydrolase
MILIVGLGNPGPKFEKSRHNVGFRVIDEFKEKNNFPGFRFSEKFNATISEAEIEEEKIILAKPQTFMNNSGKAVKSIIKYYKLKTGNLFLVHDDIDLPLAKIKIVKNRGAAGHKGVQSIINELKTKNLIRVRIGIQPKIGKPKLPEKFVLQKFNKEEEKILKGVIENSVEAIEFLIKEGSEKTMGEFNS